MLALVSLAPDDGILLLKFVAYTLFASYGGAMGYILRTMDAEKTLSWRRAALEAGSAGFVGLLVYLACRGTNLSEEWIGVLVGVCGWLGANASIRILEIMVYEKLGISRFYRHKPEPRRVQQAFDDVDEQPYPHRPRPRPRPRFDEPEDDQMPQRIVRPIVAEEDM